MVSTALGIAFIAVGAIIAGLGYLCSDHYVWGGFRYERINDDLVVGYNKLEFDRKDVYIPVVDSPDQSVIHGWLLLPRNIPVNRSLPVVIMSHGLGAQKDMGLLPYAENMVRAGDQAAFIFDYRYFGGSTATTYARNSARNLIDPWKHVADIKTVISAVRAGDLGDVVDVENIVLWGTSFAGGHMLTVARDLLAEPESTKQYKQKDNEQNSKQWLRGVISMVPHLDGAAASKRSLLQRSEGGTNPFGLVRVAVLAIADILLSSVLGMAPVYVKIMGHSNDTAAYMMMSNDEVAEYFRKHPEHYLGGWRNLAPARTLAMMSLYNPIEAVPEVDVPVLFIAATRDVLCPIDIVRTAATLGNVAKYPRTLFELDTTHFELYSGQNYRDITAKMVEFLGAVRSSPQNIDDDAELDRVPLRTTVEAGSVELPSAEKLKSGTHILNSIETESPNTANGEVAPLLSETTKEELVTVPELYPKIGTVQEEQELNRNATEHAVFTEPVATTSIKDVEVGANAEVEVQAVAEVEVEPEPEAKTKVEAEAEAEAEQSISVPKHESQIDDEVIRPVSNNDNIKPVVSAERRFDNSLTEPELEAPELVVEQEPNSGEAVRILSIENDDTMSFIESEVAKPQARDEL